MNVYRDCYFEGGTGCMVGPEIEQTPEEKAANDRLRNEWLALCGENARREGISKNHVRGAPRQIAIPWLKGWRRAPR